jgi:hypothetical protein
MHEAVISKFSSGYWLRGCSGAAVIMYITGRYTFILISGRAAQPLGLFFLDLFLVGLTLVYFYFFSKNWKCIKVTDDGIVVEYLLSQKNEVIPYKNIQSIGTYRPTGVSRYGQGYGQDLVLEFDNRSLTISETAYDNYNQIKAQIYNYKYGFDRVRSHY